MRQVLVVEDSRVIRQQIREALTEAGFEILEAKDGVEGLARLDAHPDLSLIICDVNMPRMNGLEMIEQVQQRPPEQRPPILILTTEGQPHMIDRARAAGAKGWLVKPVRAQTLAATAQRLARSA